MATIDNRFPTEGTQIDMEARLGAIETALATLMTNTTGQAINTTLQSLVGAISPQLVTEEHNLGSMNIARGSRGVFVKDVTKAGYTILGIVQIRLSNNWHCLSSFVLSGSSAQVVMQNINSNSLDQTVYATVLYIKN